jgi:hypothetical protein
MEEIASSSKTKSKIKLTGKKAFHAQAFLDSAGVGLLTKMLSRGFGSGSDWRK